MMPTLEQNGQTQDSDAGRTDPYLSVNSSEFLVDRKQRHGTPLYR